MQGATKLSPLDASFLNLEKPETHMHIGGVAVFEKSPLGTGVKLHRAMIRAIEPRLDLVPRYRQKLAFLPLSLDTPVWTDDADFDISNHVLRAHLPSPGGDAELQAYIARVFSRQLDRRRPLWEFTIIEGLQDGRWALLTKTHHALVDGISSLELVTLLLDTDPEPAKPTGVSRWTPSVSPSGVELLMDSLRDRLSRPARLIGAARAMVEQPRKLAGALRDTASGLALMAQKMRPGAASPLSGPNGPSRTYRYSRFPLEDFRTVKGVFGGTINDVVLAVVTGGLRRFLLVRGLDVASERITALCPVSIRDTSERTALGNRLAMMLVDLPLAVEDPETRMSEVRAEVDHLKARKQAVGADFLLNLAGFAPPTLHAMVARASLRQMGFDIIVTNVPGPQFPLYCQGARLVEAFPTAFLYDRQQVAIAIFSYCGWLNFGYLGDAHGMPDLDVLVEGVQDSLAELVSAARSQSSLDQATTSPSARQRPAVARSKRSSAGRGRSAGSARAPAASRTKTRPRSSTSE